MSTEYSFEIRPLVNHVDAYELLNLQSLIFGDDDQHYNMTTLLAYQANGQHLFGIFSETELFGYLVAYFGTYNYDINRPAMANLTLVLDRIGIHPDYRNIGIATRGLMALREIAMRQAVRMVTSSFSPLNGRMAYLLIRKLGAMVNTYMPYYFPDDYPRSNYQFTTGQFMAEWWLGHNRVEERLHGQRKLLTLAQYLDVQTPIINPTSVNAAGFPVPFEKAPDITDETMLLVEIPVDFMTLKQQDEDLAQAWQTHIDEVLHPVLRQNYVATDFLHDTREGRLRNFYLFSYDG